jgi:hypothetical protein
LPELSPGLSGLLYGEANDDRAKAELLMAPVLIREAEKALPVLQRQATQPAGPDGVRRVIGSSFARYRQPARAESEWSAWWAEYYDLLADLPEGALQAGMRAWKLIPSSENPQAQFLPSPADLRHLAVSTPNRDVRAYTRAKAAVDHVPPRQIPVTPLADVIGDLPQTKAWPVKRTEAEKQAVRDMFRQYDAQHKARAVERPAYVMKPTEMLMNENGVSLEMLALREKQGREV